MKVKHVIEVMGLIVACTAVGIYLYSHKHADYVMESQTVSENVFRDEIVSVNSLNIPKYYQKVVSELLVFDVEVVVNDFCSQEFQMAKASKSALDAEKIYFYFMSEEKEVSSVVYDNYFDIDGYSCPITVYEGGGRGLSIATYDFAFYKSPQIDYIQNSFYPSPTVDNYNAYLYSKEDDLEFMNRETAWQNVIKTMENLGVDMSEAVSRVTYSLNMETLAEEEQCIDVYGNEVEEEKNPEWSKSDEGYYYYITQSYMGIPFYTSQKLETDEEAVAPLRIFQSEEGILMTNLQRWFQVEKKDVILTLMDFDSIMYTIEEKYSGTIRTNPLTVTKAQLYIFPIKTGDNIYTLTPVWVCTIAENHVDWEEKAYISYIYIPINAVTGEEMLMLEN